MTGPYDREADTGDPPSGPIVGLTIDVAWGDDGWRITLGVGKLAVEMSGVSDVVLRELLDSDATADILIARREEVTEVHQPPPAS
jgi:hypothetical protein